jgi:PAS domain S-box-containing protein
MSTDRPRVLVVDDEPGFRATLTDILSARGYDCSAVGTVHEGIEAARTAKPNICLLDLKLPDGSGLDLLTRIREESPGSENIVITGFASLPTAVKALNLGAFSYIEKPYSIDRLILTLEKALERQRLVQTVRHSEQAYDQLMTATGAVIFSLDPTTWQLGNANSAFRRLLNYPADPPLLLDALLPESEREQLKHTLRELSRTRPGQSASCTFDAPLLRRDGTACWFSVNAFRVPRTVAESPAARSEPHIVPPAEFELLLICSDISAARRAVTDVERAKDFVDGVFAALPCGVVIVDSDYRVIDCNPAYVRPLGLTPEATRGRTCYDVLNRYRSPCSMFGELCPIAAARTTGAIGRVYREHRLPDGRQRNLEYTANPLRDEQGAITGFVVVLNDLTDLRETEERLRQTKSQLEQLNSELRLHHEELKTSARRLELTNLELVKLSNAKSDFVATVSHELRTPLTAIAEGIGLVEDGSLGELNPDQRTFLTLARQNTRRLTDLINDILDLSKIEAGKFELVRRRLDIRRVIRDEVSSYRVVAQERRLTLDEDLSPDLPAVLADEPSVHRILANLIGNALKFTPADGHIAVQARVQSNGTKPPAVTVAVADTGVGIPRDQQGRLFGKFEQIVREGENRPRGTGLGLALTRQLVELNQGRIWVDSEDGKGSRFSFTLPVHDERAEFESEYQRFIASGRNDGHSAIYLFQVLPANRPTPDPGAASVPLDGSVLAQVRDLVEPFFPRPSIASPLTDRGALTVFASRRLEDERFSALLDRLRGASFFTGEHEVAVRLLQARLDLPHIRGATEPGGAVRYDFDSLYQIITPLLQEVK